MRLRRWRHAIGSRFGRDDPDRCSRRAFEKAGFHREAVLHHHSVLDGAYCDNLMMARFNPAEDGDEANRRA